MRRLSIIDLEAGDQPIANEDGTVTSSRTARSTTTASCAPSSSPPGTASRPTATPRSSPTSTRSDGLDFAARLRGMFAVAVWDARRRRLVLARDRFGIKPLVYVATAASSLFASELRAQPRGEIDPDALEAYLALNWVPSPLTIFREARKLPPGHLLVGDGGEPRMERYARPAPGAPPSCGATTRPSWPRSCASALRDSVRAHLVADVPGRRAALGRRRLVRPRRAGGRGASEPLQTFSIGFDERAFNELDARASWPSATRPTTTSSWSVPTPRGSCRSSSPRSTSRSPTRRRCPTYLVSELAAEHVKVALAGEGGDELFGGYNTYTADLLAAAARRRSPRSLRPLIDLLPSSDARRPRRQGQALRRAAHLPPLERHYGWTEIFSADARAELTGRRAAFDPVDLCAPASPRRRAPSCSRACRTSTSASTSSTTCS